MSDTAAEPTDLEAPSDGSLSAWRRILFAVGALALLCLFAAPLFMDIVATNAPKARQGAVSFAGWGPLDRPAPLEGQWRVTWRSAGPGQPPPGAQGLLPVPGPWAGKTLGRTELPKRGAAAYALTIRDLPAGRYTLHIPPLFLATRVLVNGVVMSEHGSAGLTPATTRYMVGSDDIPLDLDGAPVDLRIELASFLHRDTGFETPPMIGLAKPMRRWIALEWARSFLFVTSLLLLAVYGLVVFLFRRQDRASLYFGLACLFLAPLVAIFSHDNLVLVAFPGLGFSAMLLLQYLGGIVALAAFLAYAHHLFPQESRKLPFWIFEGTFAALFVLHLAVGLTGDTFRLSEVSQVALPVRALTLLYMVGIVVAACVRRRDGAVVFLLGIGAFALGLIYSDMATNGVVPRQMDVRLAALVLLFSHIIVLAERWSIAIQAAEQRARDLRRLLDVNTSIASEMELSALLRKIVKVTSEVIRADRSSLFLHDQKTDELFSVVAEGVDEREIRFPAGQGVAGHSFTEGRAIQVADAYKEARFNPQVDAATGYHTESILTVPVTARDGRRIGVMQSLNRQNGGAFSEADLARMGAFAAQAAVAIDNATLFAEVASQRNYNESILRSMSSGVITLDRDARIAKLNDAACAILEVSAEDLEGRDARAILAAGNAWLIDEIDAVSASGQPKSLLDADIRTARGSSISANLSIVPLIGDGAQVGLLILVEDITEGKRLQGAMRRFMTQKVVDQVMSRQDELLFGTACQASVLFADIRNFTGLAENLDPRQTVDMLNEVFTDLFEAVAAHDGVLDKFIGDAIMAVYGAPLSSGRDPQNAVESAVQMVRMIEAINERRRERGLHNLRLGVGLASGDVVAGTIGSPKRMDYTVIGDSVNLASRLEAITKVYQVGIVICDKTAAALGEGAPTRELDTIRVRGRRRPTQIYQVLTGDGPAPEALAAYRRGREATARRRWAAAVEAFEAAVKADPSDRPSALMLARAQILARRPPPEDWDGVWETPDEAATQAAKGSKAPAVNEPRDGGRPQGRRLARAARVPDAG